MIKRLLLPVLCAVCLSAAAPAHAVEPASPVKTVQLTFAGDCTLGGHEGWMNYSVGTFKVMQQQVGNYSYFLEKVQPIFAADDLTLVNLEGVLSDSARGLNPERKWNFRGTTDYVRVLTEGSVEAVTLGNNHARDFGNHGLASTKDTLAKAGVGYCVDKDVFFFEKDGVRIAFLGFWETSFNSHKAWIKTEIPRLKAEEGCSAVVLLYHGGREYRQKHGSTQTDNMRYAIDCGADLVIGHHPHVIQGIEIYKNRTIFYSLGNFCYGGNRKPRTIEYPALIAGIEMGFDETGYLYQQATIHPCHISGTSPRNNYQPHLVEGALADEVMALVQADTPFPLNSWQAGVGAVQDRLYRNGEVR